MGSAFEPDTDGKPVVRLGFRRETTAWDFKRGLPGPQAWNDLIWADIAADVLAFHNQRGGVLFFGVDDASFEFVGTRDVLDPKRFNDKVRRYVGDKLWVEFAREFIQPDQRYLGVALIPPRGVLPVRLKADAPTTAEGGKRFSAGDLCIREGDQTRIYRGKEAEAYLAANRLPSPDARYLVRESNARILRPDWEEFLTRQELCQAVETALGDDRTYVTTLSGIGGVGKTALACWAVLKAYNDKRFDYIVSVSAKDRELAAQGGIRPVESSLSSFEDLLDQVLQVLGFSEHCQDDVADRERVVRQLLPEVSGLLFVDNLETVEDRRIINFLENLPKPTKAITTSRKITVRTAAFPITVGPLTSDEAVRFLETHARRRGKHSLVYASAAEKRRLVEACSCVPLAIEWLVGQAKDLDTALQLASALSSSGKRDDELLEFCFRRVHSDLSERAKEVLAALTLDERPQILEAITAACGASVDLIDDALAELEACSLVERVWEDKMHDFAFRVLALTRRFAYRELQRHTGRETAMRQRLSHWYEGRDVDDTQQREMIVAVRRGTRDPDTILVEAAISFRKQGKVGEAETYFQRAIERNPRSWRAYREYAELLRDRESIGAALQQYELAAQYAPRRGEDRALIFREWGMVLRKSGTPHCQAEAVEKFEVACRETPNDPLLLHALAGAYLKLGHLKNAEPILESLLRSQHPETRARTYPLLEECYSRLGESLKLGELQQRKAEDSTASSSKRMSKRTVESTTRPLLRKTKKRR